MRRVARAPRLAVVVLAAATLTLGTAIFPLPAEAIHASDPHSPNMVARGESLRPGGFTDPIGWDTRNTDLAFWGKYAIQGRYDGFRIVDISNPNKPKEVSHFPCVSDQGDVAVWGHLVFRSVNSPITTPVCQDRAVPTPTIGGQRQPGFEGLQIFDISDVRNPKQIGWVATDCGSHTQTLVPDLKRKRLIIYPSTSGTSNMARSEFGNICFADLGYVPIVEVPLENPAAARVIGRMDLHPSHHCHDIGVLLGNVNKAICAGVPENVVLDISDPANPVALAHFTYVPTQAERELSPGVPNPDARALTGWHSGAFTWDGKVMIMGWEPGGGPVAECEADDPDYEKALFFYETPTAAGVTPRLLGRWVLQRPQSDIENCTIHNYNILPNPKRYIVVHGSYQLGTSVVDFTDPANAFEVAYSDPPPLDRSVHPRGGVWSSYFYNGVIYESDTTRGLRIYEVKDKAVKGTRRLRWLNPQTQEFTLLRDADDDDGEDGDDDD